MDKIQAYKGLLALVSKTLARVSTQALALKNGGRRDMKKLKKLEKELNQEVEFLLSKKEECSFLEGLIFTEDNAFIGFSIENGVIKGDLEKAKEWASKYYRDDVDLSDSKQRYFYEVACYVLALALYQ